MSQLYPEMKTWLTDNREAYEFYLLHAMFHDMLRRSAMLNVPVAVDDFRREEYSLVVDALHRATTVMRIIGQSVAAPPSAEFLRTYVDSAARELASDRTTVDGAMQLVRELQDPSLCAMHYCVAPYFQAWYGATRAKRAARALQREDIPDVQGQVQQIQMALAKAAEASCSEEDDEMMQVMYGTSLEHEERRTTGITGLDECLNGGWGSGECYLLFGGTGGGKSVAAGQCAWHAASAGGHPLIVSTELRPREYVARMVSQACSIPINIIQDCENFAQIRLAVAGQPELAHKLHKVEEALGTIQERVRIAKVSSEDGMDARAVLERETLRYESQVGCRPTWVCLDWLGSVADLGGGKGGTSERAMAWEISATGCVKFAEDSGIPTLVLAQAVNDAQLKRVLTINDIGIAKGIGKNMVAVIGITNSIDKASIALASSGKAEIPRSMVLEDQFFCVCKARKGEGQNIPVRRDFRNQRFVLKSRD